jgi:hypothetical protein
LIWVEFAEKINVSGLTDVVWGTASNRDLLNIPIDKEKKRKEKRSKRIQLKLFEVKHCCVG